MEEMCPISLGEAMVMSSLGEAMVMYVYGVANLDDNRISSSVKKLNISKRNHHDDN